MLSLLRGVQTHLGMIGFCGGQETPITCPLIAKAKMRIKLCVSSRS